MFERRPPQKDKEGCDIKVKRDSKGNITHYKSNGKCSSAEIQHFEKSVSEDLREKDYDE